MIKRYKVSVLNTVVMGNPGYVLIWSPSPERAYAYVESFGYLVSGEAVEFPVSA